MKKILIHSLLKKYSYITIAIISVFASIVAYTNYRSYMHTVHNIEDRVLNRVTEEVNYYYRRVKQELYSISRDRNKLESISQYFKLSPSEYQLWLMQHPLSQHVSLSFHGNINNIYLQNEFIDGIDIALTSESSIFTSSRSMKSGKKRTNTAYVKPENALSFVMFEDTLSSVFATVFVSFDQNELTRILENETTMPIAVRVSDSLDNVIYSTKNMSSATMRKQAMMDGDLKISVGISNTYIVSEVMTLTSFIFLGSILLIVLLLALLRYIFYLYQNQIMDLVDTMQKISHDDVKLRIDTSTKKQELFVISEHINDMLDMLDKNITEIYQLQLSQKDANMRALQAQINPHFLYNTLEFFRMYAVTKDEQTLANMIYEFSSLLRNSISPKKEATISEELSFCEKHSYIYQIRHPKSIAYAYTIEEGCEDIVIPRFSIQPLIENYFVHGIDLRQINNAVSVKVMKHKKDVEILIRDNGKGMDEETLVKYQNILSQRDVSEINKSNSIGIVNVHERLLFYFGESYTMTLSSQLNRGVTYSIYLSDILSKECNDNV